MANLSLSDPEEIKDAIRPVAENGVPGPKAARLLDIGNDHYLKYFEREIIDELIIEGGATCRFYEGPYGVGKTHLLQLFSETALDKDMAVVKIDLSQGLNLDDWRLITQYILQNIEVRLNGETVKSLPAILEALGKSGIGNKATLKTATLSHPGFQNAMSLIMDNLLLRPQAKTLLNEYLSGGKVTVGELRKAGIRKVTNSLSAKNSEQVLKTALNGLYYAGIRGTVILFDENENQLETTKSIPSRKVQLAANVMRRLIDNCTVGGLCGVLVVFAVLPNFTGNCAKAYPALGQRIIIRNSISKAAWRWPLVDITAINTVDRYEEFADLAITRFKDIVIQCNGSVNGIDLELKKEAERIFYEAAGSGYKRKLMKALATVSLKHIEN